MSKAYASFALDELVPQVADVNAKANSTALAEAYDPEQDGSYAVGDYVTYDGGLYKCVAQTTNPPGDWDSTKWSVDSIYKNKPYDAEVEWIQLGSGAYIDTGISCADTSSMDFSHTIKLISGINKYNSPTFAGVSDSGMFGVMNLWYTENICVSLGGNSSTNQVAVPRNFDTFNKISVSGTQVYVDDVLAGSAVRSKNAFSGNYYIGRACGDTTSPTVNASTQHSAASLSINGVLVRDFIAVRKGTVGYFYDRVTNTLFGNAGTGTISYGSDKAATLPLMDGTAAHGSSEEMAPIDHVHPTDTTRAPLASPAFTGTPTAPTASSGTNTMQVATTAFVQTAIGDKADSTSLAAAYDPEKSPGYAVGDYCTYQGVLYRCTTATADPSGAWTGNVNWTPVAVTDEIGGGGAPKKVWYGTAAFNNSTTPTVTSDDGHFVFEDGNIIYISFFNNGATPTNLSGNITVDGTTVYLKSVPGFAGSYALTGSDINNYSTWAFLYSTKNNVNCFCPVGYLEATTSKRGIVLLTDTIDTTTSTKAATPKGVGNALASKAPIASPAFTGTPTAPDYGSSPATTSQVATINYVQSSARYSIATPTQTITTTTNTDDTLSLTLYDRAINQVSIPSTVTDATISFPAKTAGYARDFFVRLTITGSTVPAITWQEANGDPIDFDVDDESWADIEQGVNILMFTETNQASAS